MLVIEKLKHSFSSTRIFDQFDFVWPKGDIHRIGLLGPNGSGKTTLFKIIAGFLKADAGNIFWEDDAIFGLRPDQINQKGICYTFQAPQVFDNLTVSENVYLALKDYIRAEDRESNVHVFLNNFDLTSKKHMLASHLSVVEKRMLEIARALATHPKLLLLDECLVGLRDVERQKIIKLLHAYQKKYGFKIMMIEHNLAVMQSFCDHLIVLNAGKIIASGTPDSCLKDPNVQKVYFSK
jgi:ABC-type branched-subunit amino acid transport system ATPase component